VDAIASGQGRRQVSAQETVIVVFGGTSGIGLAVAREALSRGARVIVTGRSRDRLERARGQLQGEFEARVLDALDEEGVGEFFAERSGVDHIFVTAGSVSNDHRLEAGAPALRATMDSRFLAALYAAKYGGPKIRQGGSITFMSGTASVRPLPGASIASASCGAVEALARALAIDLAPVRVNAIRPGFIDTPFLHGVLGEQREAILAGVVAKLPVGRIGRVEEAAHAVLFLMENQFVTGTSLTIDGGGSLV
jgi:NAD(P)-dependent dehydrogenase (short-subunit alcohol dehydrogenase family)